MWGKTNIFSYTHKLSYFFITSTFQKKLLEDSFIKTRMVIKKEKDISNNNNNSRNKPEAQ